MNAPPWTAGRLAGGRGRDLRSRESYEKGAGEGEAGREEESVVRNAWERGRERARKGAGREEESVVRNAWERGRERARNAQNQRSFQTLKKVRKIFGLNAPNQTFSV
jgi:hypothetical protein